MLMCLGNTILPSESSKKVLLRYRAPPLMACTKPPSRPAASGDSNNTGHSVVGILRDFRRDSARWAAYTPSACGLASSDASRMELYQASRCMLSPRPAIGDTDILCRELAYPPRNPRVCALKKCDCWAETPAPSLLVMRRLTFSAAASHSMASCAACSLVTAQGWNRSRSRWVSASGAMSSASGRPAVGSSAVKRAMS